MLDSRTVQISAAPREHARLEQQGFQLVAHSTAVRNFLDSQELERVYYPEVRDLIMKVTGARAAAVAATPFVRFGERASQSGQVAQLQAGPFRPHRLRRRQGQGAGRTGVRHTRGPRVALQALRALQHLESSDTAAQDIPLAVCDARSLAREDLIEALAVFDFAGVPERTADSYVVRHNPAHRWHYFRDMTPEEALIFVTNESDPARPHHVPHVAFDDPTCPATATPRSSVEVRVVAYFE